MTNLCLDLFAIIAEKPILDGHKVATLLTHVKSKELAQSMAKLHAVNTYYDEQEQCTVYQFEDKSRIGWQGERHG